MIDEVTLRRFWNKVNKDGPTMSLMDTPCWEWTGCKVKGYGQIRLNGKSVYAHRLAWEMANGPIENGLHCLRECDNRVCVNPAHLILGTRAETMAGRSGRGEAGGRAKLTANQVEVARKLAAWGGPVDAATSLMADVNGRVSESGVRQAVNGLN